MPLKKLYGSRHVSETLLEKFNQFINWLNTYNLYKLYVDNQGALKLIHHPHSHQRTKHINTAYRFIQDRVERGEIICEYVETASLVADCITKAIPLVKLNENKTDM
jgi:hypothetical protein